MKYDRGFVMLCFSVGSIGRFNIPQNLFNSRSLEDNNLSG